MSLLHKKQGEKIRKTKQTIMTRGLPEDSFFAVEFDDGSVRSEHDTNWSDMSELTTVVLNGKPKQVMLCKHPIKKATVVSKIGKSHTVFPDSNNLVYQAVRVRDTFKGGKLVRKEIIGRVIGVVKDGVVLEEKLI